MNAVVEDTLLRRIADLRALYRMFDSEGRVLYIGISGIVGRRFDQHSQKAWFPQVATITLEWFPTEAAAVLAERRAIAAERPRYNIAGKKPSSRPERSAKLKPLPLEVDLPDYALDDLVALSAVRADLASGTARKRRESYGVSASEVARALGVTRQAIAAWEVGKIIPARENALAYARLMSTIASAFTEPEAEDSADAD